MEESQIFRTLSQDSLSKGLTALIQRMGQQDEVDALWWLIDLNAYKKGMYHGWIPEFMDQCRPMYHTSKQKYVNRECTFTSFTTVLRQICNYCQIPYRYKVKSIHSQHQTLYMIQLPFFLTNVDEKEKEDDLG